jgi:spermidine/putrescine transport system permease protein
MMRPGSGNWLLRAYAALVFVFVFAPIITAVIFSFDTNRFPSLPMGGMTTHWYELIGGDANVWEAARISLTVSVVSALLATFIGFGGAYTDFRYTFVGKSLFLGLALLPPTIPLIIMAVAMLGWFANFNLSGQVISIIIAHTVLTAPFAMAVIRLRLNQMDPSLEAAAWNMGASEWRAMREVIVPFTLPAIVSALCLTAAVSFDEFAIAWFVSGLNKTIPVFILEIFTGNVDPRVNAIGSFVFLTSVTLIVASQLLLMQRSRPAEAA